MGWAAPVEVTYQGVRYSLDVTTCFTGGLICHSPTNFQSNPWFNNSGLAEGLANATRDSLGTPNNRYPGNQGPYFIYNSGDPNRYNVTFLPWEGFSWDPVANKAYKAGGSWNSYTGTGNGRNTTHLATQAAPPRYAILAANNGKPINTTTSLANGTLLPVFQGGTLQVSAAGTIQNAFTLSGDQTNAIDANGNNATFSGAFSDEAGATGTITFKNSGSSAAVISLSAQSTYSGFTYINDNTTLQIATNHALPGNTLVALYGNGSLALGSNNQAIGALGGSGSVELGSGTLALRGGPALLSNSGATITGTGGLVMNGAYTQVLTGNSTYSGSTVVKAGTLQIGSGGSIQSNTRVEGGTLSVNGTLTGSVDTWPGGTLQGTGTVAGDVFNEGTVSPGNSSIGTLTVNGSYIQGATNPNANLNIEVNGSSSDLLHITGDNQVILLGGNLNISSYQGAPISPAHIYTAIDVTGSNPLGGEIGLKTNLNVIGSSGTAFVRETNPWFAMINKRASEYYSICTSSDSAVQQRCTKLQFAWLILDPKTNQPINPANYATPGKTTINSVKQTGGAITMASTGNPTTNTNNCIANGGSTASCQQQNQKGSGSGAHNNNTVAVAKTLDAGWASVGAAVTSGVSGGAPIGSTGYTTEQTKAALVPSDFAKVIGALFAVPTRQQLNQALHSITAEPYASMQSVALEALEQFRANTLALSSGSKAIPFTTKKEVCQSEAPQKLTNAQPIAADCKPRTVTTRSPWSLLIDGTNSQATLNGTNNLASLDYNIFSSSYGLQYDFNRQWSAGAALGYGQANLYNYEYADVRIDSSTYSGSIWGTYRPSAPWKLTALAGYMNLQYESDRHISFGGLNRTANANWSGNGFTTALAAEYDWVLAADRNSRSAVRIKPNTFLSYALHHQDSFSETGAGALNLAVNSHTADSLIYGVGFQLETPIITGESSRLIPRLSLGYEHDFNGDTNEEHQISSSFAEAPALGTIDVLGQNRGANAVDIGLSLEYETSNSLSLYAGVGGAFWSNGNELNYGGGLKVRW